MVSAFLKKSVELETRRWVTDCRKKREYWIRSRFLKSHIDDISAI